MTAAELAKHLNLSRTTVSVVLNGRAEKYGLSQTTVDRVLQGARRFNYQPDIIARQLAGVRSNVVGILVNSACVVDPRLIEKMEILAAEKQIRFIVGHAIGNDGEKVLEYIQDFRGRRVDAIISFHHNNGSYRDMVLRELSKLDRVLYYERPDVGIADPWFVEVDIHEVGRVATQHLIDRGCRRIGLVGLAETIYGQLSGRRRGYEDAVRAAGLPLERDLVWTVDEKRSLRWIEPPDEAEANAIVDQLVVRGKADAIFAVNDLYVARLAEVLEQRGLRVPHDVALVGCDNMDISTLVRPRVTTVDVQIDALAQAMVTQLFEMMGQASDAGSEESTSAAPPAARGHHKSEITGTGRGSKSSSWSPTSAPSPHGIVVKPKLVVRQSA